MTPSENELSVDSLFACSLHTVTVANYQPQAAWVPGRLELMAITSYGTLRSWDYNWDWVGLGEILGF